MNAITNHEIEKIKELISGGIDAWIEAGELIAGILDHSPCCIEDLAEELGVTVSVVRKFEGIGNKKIFPRLLTNDSRGMRRLSRCSYSIQEFYCSNPVEVITKNEDEASFLKVSVENLTPKQCKIVFDGDHVRTLSEQRAYLESCDLKKKGDIDNIDFLIRNKRLIVFKSGMSFSVRAVEKILHEMKNKRK